MRAHIQRQPGSHRPRPRPIHWGRLTIFLIISLTLAYGTLLIILASGNVIPILWFYILGPVITLIEFIITLYFSMFPLTSGDTPTRLSPPQQPPSTHPTTQTNISAPTTPIWNVPYPHSPFFIGRDTLLTQLYDILHDEKAAALTQAISGLGGIGKTQLAVEYAYRNRDKYQAILWTPPTTSETLFTDFVTLAEVLYLPEKYTKDKTITVSAVKRCFAPSSTWS